MEREASEGEGMNVRNERQGTTPKLLRIRNILHICSEGKLTVSTRHCK